MASLIPLLPPGNGFEARDSPLGVPGNSGKARLHLMSNYCSVRHHLRGFRWIVLAFFFFLTSSRPYLSILQLRPRKATNLVKVTHKKNIRMPDPPMLTSPRGNTGNSLKQKARRSLPGYPAFLIKAKESLI